MSNEPLDLTPNEVNLPTKRGIRSFRNWLVIGGFCVLLGFILFQALTSARVYFLHVDEALEQKSSLGDDQFRMQGEVLELNDPDSSEFVFVLGHNNEKAVVLHTGNEPTELFVCGQSVVVEGRWSGQSFISEKIRVKHSEEYREEYSERLEEVNTAADAKCEPSEPSAQVVET